MIDQNVLERFQLAVTALAAGQGRLQERLADAFASHLQDISPDELPEDEAGDFGQVTMYLTRKPAEGDEGTIAATVRTLDNEGAAELVSVGKCRFPSFATGTNRQ
jgi:hypothetical protein